MASVFRRVRRKPMPPGARIVTKKGVPHAEWRDGKGRLQSAPVSGDGSSIRVYGGPYWVKYIDAHGAEQRVPTRCHDYDAAMQMGRELERKAMQRREGLLDPAQERFAKATREPIAEHAAAHVCHLRDSGNTEKHVQAVERHLRILCVRAGIIHLKDFGSQSILAAVAELRKGIPLKGGRQKTASLSTCNSYLRSAKGFARWLYKQRLTSEDLLLDVKLFNAATDRRHLRREMSADEVRRLLAVTQSRTTPDHGAPGPVRAMCYRLAAATGFRANELRSLIPESFNLDGIPPTCTVEAASSKRRKRDVQPLPDAIVPLIRSWLASQTPRRPIFKSIAGDTARMLRSDLAAARQAWIGEAKQDEAETVRRQESDFLAYRDQHGRVADFHSLRVVFISRVVAGGASVREAQTLARHSTPTLTMNVYSQASLLEVAGAVNGLGDLLSTAPAPELLPEGNVRASGTGETPSGVPCPARKIDPLIDPSERALGGTRRHSGGDIGVVSGPLSEPSAQQKTPAKPGKTGTSQGSKAERLRSESNRRWRICNPLP